MDDKIKKDIYKLSYINNTFIDGDQVPAKIIVFYGRTNPVTKKIWEISVDELKGKFQVYVDKKFKSKEGEEGEENPLDEDYIFFNDILNISKNDNIMDDFKLNILSNFILKCFLYLIFKLNLRFFYFYKNYFCIII